MRSIAMTAKMLLFAGVMSVQAAHADTQLKTGRSAVHSLTGCYIIDYSYTETKGLKPGYTRDERVYDVNRGQTVKEWIYVAEETDNRIRLQHILFSTDLAGNMIEGSMLKHQVEEWEYGAAFRYDFVAPLTWAVEDLTANRNLWTRKVTNLDDGLRYQCAAAWSETSTYPEWTCNNFAPIPGRETRDMGRKDYNTLDRTTTVVAYKNSWLERQNNTKTIFENGAKTPLAAEVGKNWYVRLPDTDCKEAQAFANDRQPFWSLLSEIWSEVLSGDRPFVEKTIPGQPPRFMKVWAIEDQYYTQDLNDLSVRARAKQEVIDTINAYRAN